MIESVLTWLQLQNLLGAEGLSASNFVLLVYLVTYRKSYLMGTTFLFAEIYGTTNGFYALIPFAENPDKVYTLFDTLNATGQQLHGSLWFLGLALIFSQFAIMQFKHNNGKSIRYWCATMILFLLLMAWDSFVNADIETFIWRSYEYVVLSIHVGIALSFYRPKTIIDGMVNSIRNYINNKLHVHAFASLWYTK